MLTIASISLSDAKRIINAAEAKATQIGSPSNVAVVDAGGNLVAHVRMDGAQLASISHSINKAFTSLACKTATKDLAADAQPGAPLYGIANSVDGRIITFAGGIPLKSGESFVGAVGVSGGTADQDQAVAEAAVAAL
ncbi:GlcG/HbpS family heme-binding protein [Pseudomonas bohemica]|uniref:GlcG/HbpS family heme-binding protein n=1 Tax=Pseudomonas bohemica TaxID=2044872 RepID=UPI000DA6227F|nr:heme-binding protein [Pseudomonas bohemica]